MAEIIVETETPLDRLKSQGATFFGTFTIVGLVSELCE